MIVTDKDIEKLGINYISTDIDSNVLGIGGILPKRQKEWSNKVENVLFWKDLDIKYMGGYDGL